jgi:hypothetical protein
MRAWKIVSLPWAAMTPLWAPSEPHYPTRFWAYCQGREIYHDDSLDTDATNKNRMAFRAASSSLQPMALLSYVSGWSYCHPFQGLIPSAISIADLNKFRFKRGLRLM